jgi:hypothetical protein
MGEISAGLFYGIKLYVLINKLGEVFALCINAEYEEWA